ncbi:MAG TPA: hypothetical protein VKG23_13140 [Thermoanaerobaculia bacterium]|nr:hypothetical protein [Thermoanaerobaculia bacterium]
MAKAPKTAYELAMERLQASDPKGAKQRPLTAKQKEEIAEVKRAATARLAEREILFKDALKKMADPAERETAESNYLTDRRRIDEDCERQVEAIRRGK